jgi:hypothetical protein
MKCSRLFLSLSADYGVYLDNWINLSLYSIIVICPYFKLRNSFLLSFITLTRIKCEIKLSLNSFQTIPSC